MDEMAGAVHALFLTMEEVRGDIRHLLLHPPQSAWVTQPGEASATVNDALTELLNCAELNQDDIEDETRALIARTHALLSGVIDSITCFDCNAAVPTLHAAVEQGWRELEVDRRNKERRYRGLCPNCHEKEVERDTEKAEQQRRGRQRENKTLFE